MKNLSDRRHRVRLITFSGTAGSGKTTCATHANAVIQAAGMPVEYVRFQLLPCFRVLQKSFYYELFSLRRAKSTSSGSEQEVKKQVSTKPTSDPKYSLRTLTLPVAAGYALRICLFRLYLLFCHRGKTIIADRYFYDNLAGYHLTSKREIFYISVLKWFIRAPELPVLLLGSAARINQRRPYLPMEFVESKLRSWELVRQKFPELAVVSIDDVATVNNSVEKLIAEHFDRVRSHA